MKCSFTGSCGRCFLSMFYLVQEPISGYSSSSRQAHLNIICSANFELLNADEIVEDLPPVHRP
jgi:hypothetical protein